MHETKLKNRLSIIAIVLFAASFVIFTLAGSLSANDIPIDHSQNVLSAEDSTTTPDSAFATTTPEIDPLGNSVPADISNASSTAADTLATSTPGNISQDPAATNTNTGADSTNTSQINANNQTDVTNENNAITTNYSYLKSDTGNNNASYNTGSGIITTQSAKGQGELINVINRNQLTVDPGSGTGPINATNNNTGEGSTNEANVNINNQLTVRNINNSNTINKIDAEVNSGQNQAGQNTGHGIILTGDASLGLNFISLANTNLYGSQRFYANWQNIYDNFSGNINLSTESAFNLSPLSDLLIQASNNSTGANSSNQAIVNVNDQTSIINQNSGNLNNEINAEVVSGRNKSNYNTGTGSVTSGSVNAAVNVVNFLNSNINSSNWWLKSLNVFGNWTGDILLPRMYAPNLVLGPSSSTLQASSSNTGADSTNSAQINSSSSLDVANQNEAYVTNNVMMKTNTGENKTSYNGGSGIVKFGQADAETNELNVTNLNVTGDSWWMVVVNKYGNWVGTTLGSPSDAIVSGSGNTTVITPQNSGITVGNDSTGPESNNIAGANINHSTDISNTNQANILNTVNIDAVSGENEAQYNTGHGYVDTGDIRASANLVNFANANINVGNWLVTVVNVFGDWHGNLVFDTPASDGTAFSGLIDQMGGSSGASNQNTGADSSNTANTNTDNSTNIGNTNNANTNSTTSASSLTGENNANYNTGSGIVSTGQANTNSGITNDINNNTTGLGGGCTANASSSNVTTGEGSDNTSTANASCSTDVTNNNTSNLNNNYTVNNTTGQNSANYNTGNGVIDTSWANTYLGLYNQANSNTITMQDLQEEFGNGTTTNATSTDSTANGNGTATDSGADANNNNNSSNGGPTDNSGTQAALSGGGGGGGGGSLNLDTNLNNASSTVSILQKKAKGDLNGDGKVDDYDFSILMSGWGKTGNTLTADTNEDSKIDDFDFSVVMGNWTKILAVIK